MLHFDVTQGCTAQILIAALLDLGVPHDTADSSLQTFGELEAATFEELRERAHRAGLAPIVRALVDKVFGLLADASARRLNNVQATRVMREVVGFAELLAKLNPLELSATRVPLSWSPANLNEEGLGGLDLVLTLSENVPTYEQEWPAPYADAVGLALLKCAASRFGPRGESRLLRSGLGAQETQSGLRLVARALWCEPAMIATRAVEAESSTPTVIPLVQISGVLGVGVDGQELIRRLSTLGSRSVLTTQVFELGLYPRTHIRLIAPFFDVEKIVEALLVTGECAELVTSFVEQHALVRRTVAVPFGRGQKQEQCRVIEWLWGDRVLRAEPLGADLGALVQITGYAQEVVRGDVLMAWKKWRGFE